MWLFTRYGFFSISVSDESVWVRARAAGHLRNLCGRFGLDSSSIIEGAGTDYAYRIRLDRETWEGIVLALAKEQDWSNFKNEAARFNKYGDYVKSLHRVWDLMYELQEK